MAYLSYSTKWCSWGLSHPRSLVSWPRKKLCGFTHIYSVGLLIFTHVDLLIFAPVKSLVQVPVDPCQQIDPWKGDRIWLSIPPAPGPNPFTTVFSPLSSSAAWKRPYRGEAIFSLNSGKVPATPWNFLDLHELFSMLTPLIPARPDPRPAQKCPSNRQNAF